MCGIAGIVNFAGLDTAAARERVTRMTGVMTHRGPDADGFYVDAKVALGHRRLSIIDLKSGQQPMSDLDGQLQITFNGEIYNFLQLRDELESLGCRFRTNCDTEVILKAYTVWGEDCLDRFNGMFAFALWDARASSLFLARDRVGKKPLYYYFDDGFLAFGSEIKALIAGGVPTGKIDPEALDCYLTLGYIPAPRTIYSRIRKLRPGHSLVVTPAGSRAKRYWRLEFHDPADIALEDATEEFGALLDDAVRCRMISDVPLGAFLSGGLDSSLVVSSMARQQSDPVRTHSVGFTGGGDDELAAAGVIARHLQTDHREFVATPDAADVLEKIAWHFDEPLADSSALPTWYVCEMTRQSVTVALSGDGGDEAFAGYTFRYLPHLLESRIRHTLPMWLRKPLFGVLGTAWPSSAKLPRALRLKTIFGNLAVSDGEAFYRDLAWLRHDDRLRLYRPEFLRSLQGFTAFETVQPYYCREGVPDNLARSQLADINVYMTDDVLVKVDRMSMAHSLEVRAPLLDYRILEFAAMLPARVKVDSRSGKLPLRRLAAARLPHEVQAMPKRGFDIPAAEWLRGGLRPMAEELVLEQSRVVADVFDQATLRKVWQQHLGGRRDHSVFFWGLMMLALWEQQGAAA